ncbi:hypothetical protein [Sorangium sp. So ce388]|uniref:hypothetical protein n=1 Tax=Sorangium sp. So ce388 TaxID=3133309 RepID=UPI003F5B8B9F
MFVPDLRITLCTAMVLAPSLTCVGPREAPEAAGSGGTRVVVGEARGRLCFGQMIANVVVFPETYHWEDPAHLLSVAEGFGPRILDVAVSASVEPSVDITGTVTGTFERPSAQPSSGTAGGPGMSGIPGLFGLPGAPVIGVPGAPATPGSRSPTGDPPFWGGPGNDAPPRYPPFWGMPGNGAPSEQPPWGTPGNGAPSEQPPWGMPGGGAAPSAQPSSSNPGSGLLGGCTPSSADISDAVGFSVSESITLEASTSYFVPTAAYARVSAYPVFQKITWDIVSLGGWSFGAGPGGVVVGSGVVLKPVGVYFATYRAYDLAAMGGGIVSPGPILDPPGGAGGAGGGAGAGDAGGGQGAGGADGGQGAGGADGGQGAGGAGGGQGPAGSAGATGGGWWIGGTGGGGSGGGP